MTKAQKLKQQALLKLKNVIKSDVYNVRKTEIALQSYPGLLKNEILTLYIKFVTTQHFESTYKY